MMREPRERHRTSTSVTTGLGLLLTAAIVVSACGSSEPAAQASQPTASAPATTVVGETISDTTTAPADDPDDAVEFVDLPYFERVVPQGAEFEPAEECDTPEPGVRICEYSTTAELIATHLGRTSETQTGLMTMLEDETCEVGDYGSANPWTADFSGTITTAWGDELHFHGLVDLCVAGGPGAIDATGFWVVDGGTGRFEDASGTMSYMAQAGIEHGTSVGTLRVRADRWRDELPAGAFEEPVDDEGGTR